MDNLMDKDHEGSQLRTGSAPLHTQGPWYYHRQSNTINGGGLTVALMSEINWQNERLRPQVEADAHLIASAPELLEALKRIANTDPNSMTTFAQFTAWAQSLAREAIAKAGEK